MSATVITGTYRGGRIELDESVDWPEGRRVSVVAESATLGLREEEWPDTPENRAEILRRMEAVEPLELTAEDEGADRCGTSGNESQVDRGDAATHGMGAMRRYLLDTGIASDYINRRRGVFEKANDAVRRGGRVGVCVPVAGELFAGVELSDTRDKNLERLRRSLKSLHIWPYEFTAAQEFGRLAAVLKRMGRTMQQIDVQIAAIALTLGDCTVVSKDSDLFAVPGLDVDNWVTS